MNKFHKCLKIHIRNRISVNRNILIYGIINISSSTIFGSPKRAHYVASKAALLGLTRTMAREVGEHGININTVCPGSTVTDDLDDPEENQRRKQGGGGNRALKRLEDPEDLVGTIVFLSSNESDFITGQTIVASGGRVTLP